MLVRQWQNDFSLQVYKTEYEEAKETHKQILGIEQKIQPEKFTPHSNF